MTLFGSPEDELSRHIPELTTLEDIVPDVLKGKVKSVDMLSEIARGYGLSDMHDVTREALEMSKLVEFVPHPGNQELLMPQMNVEVTYENAPDIMRMLSAGTIVSMALMLNPEFKVHWDAQFIQDGIFGATWQNGYYHFRRPSGINALVYADMIEAYWGQLTQVNDFFMKKHTQYTALLDQFKNLRNK